ncbi:biotin--[acetyl-CoA-carboxylase] ligase [Candidatus Soleaferrea massiliensis]|uniref:biotin--[acetyl-CoA-carboxylase] ligase n=1 Tax=Candidatus Soleaferrea massiliensis TaxID=1470354 RepID=UPI00058F582F|nr:biotin--[acetyl-CoA-carboxylase] ligase [Candidatus Soleaferrea massiliensis]
MALKQDILRMLEERRGESVSGAQMADTLDVTRSAVWKAVKALQDEGHQIEAGTNRGYCLKTSSDVLSVPSIQKGLKTQRMGRSIFLYKTLDSTNIEAKRLAQEGAEHGTVVLAEEQTAGRGRMGHSFYSPKQAGIYMSVILRPKLKPEEYLLFTCAAAVAAARAVASLYGIECSIKWINDLFVGKKKVGGIMTEASMNFEDGRFDYVVIGIGLNVSTSGGQFGRELRCTATSLQAASGRKDIFRTELIAEILNQLEMIEAAFEEKTFFAEYKRRLFLLGQRVDVQDDWGVETVTALDIDEHARLIVQCPDGGIKKLQASQVHVRLHQE